MKLALHNSQVAMDDYNYLFKIILIGDANVGKTCLVRRFAKGYFPPGQSPTIGVDFSIKTVDVDGEKVKVSDANKSRSCLFVHTLETLVGLCKQIYWYFCIFCGVLRTLRLETILPGYLATSRHRNLYWKNCLLVMRKYDNWRIAWAEAEEFRFTRNV